MQGNEAVGGDGGGLAHADGSGSDGVIEMYGWDTGRENGLR
jgi:hypothetical protein